MVESSDILVAHADKNLIIVEIMPWLYQFKLLGETGNEVLAMVKAYDKMTNLYLCVNTST